MTSIEDFRCEGKKKSRDFFYQWCLPEIPAPPSTDAKPSQPPPPPEPPTSIDVEEALAEDEQNAALKIQASYRQKHLRKSKTQVPIVCSPRNQRVVRETRKTKIKTRTETTSTASTVFCSDLRWQCFRGCFSDAMLVSAGVFAEAFFFLQVFLWSFSFLRSDLFLQWFRGVPADALDIDVEGSFSSESVSAHPFCELLPAVNYLHVTFQLRKRYLYVALPHRKIKPQGSRRADNMNI